MRTGFVCSENSVEISIKKMGGETDIPHLVFSNGLLNDPVEVSRSMSRNSACSVARDGRIIHLCTVRIVLNDNPRLDVTLKPLIGGNSPEQSLGKHDRCR